MAFGPPSQYDPSSFGISFLVRWNGTILPLVTSSPLFWLLIFIHCLNLYLFNTFEGEEPLLDWKAAMVTSSLLTFQLVSYGQQCLARYFALYQFCTGLHGACMEWAALIKLEFGHHSHAVQWNILRFMLGALQVHYALLGGDEVDVGGIAKKGISDDEWRAIRSRNLLSHDETERLKAYGGFKPFMPVGWALAEVKGKLLGVSAAEADRTPIGDNVPTRLAFDRFNQVAFKFRSDSSQTFAMLNAPLPFAYFHILKMLLLLSLGIISYALTGLLDGQVVLSMVVFVLVCLVMVGLAEIAIAMSDPFGEDEADFDLDAFLASVYNNSVAYLLDTHSVHLDGLPQGMHNPLDDDQSHLRVWKDDAMQHGLVDRRKTVRDLKSLLPPARAEQPPQPATTMPAAPIADARGPSPVNAQSERTVNTTAVGAPSPPRAAAVSPPTAAPVDAAVPARADKLTMNEIASSPAAAKLPPPLPPASFRGETSGAARPTPAVASKAGGGARPSRPGAGGKKARPSGERGASANQRVSPPPQQSDRNRPHTSTHAAASGGAYTRLTDAELHEA